MTTKTFTIRSILSSEKERLEKIEEMEKRDFEVTHLFEYAANQSIFMKNGKRGPKFSGMEAKLKYGVLFRKVGGY